MSSDTMLEEVETLDRPSHAPDDGGPDPGQGELVEGRLAEGSGGDPEAPTEPPVPKRRPRKVRSLTLDDWLSLGGSVLASFALVYVGYSAPGGLQRHGRVCRVLVLRLLAGLRDRRGDRQPPAHRDRAAGGRHPLPDRRARHLCSGIHGHLHVRRGLAGIRPPQLLHPRHGRGVHGRSAEQGRDIARHRRHRDHGGDGRGRGRAPRYRHSRVHDRGQRTGLAPDPHRGRGNDGALGHFGGPVRVRHARSSVSGSARPDWPRRLPSR